MGLKTKSRSESNVTARFTGQTFPFGLFEDYHTPWLSWFMNSKGVATTPKVVAAFGLTQNASPKQEGFICKLL